MQLGFVSAIFPDLDLEGVLQFAGSAGFSTVEIMCWPEGRGENRRYAGVTHINAADFSQKDARRVASLTRRYGVTISGLGYYPNPLCGDAKESAFYIAHLEKVISAARLLGLQHVNTFIGRDHTRSMADNWNLFDQRWPKIIRHAEKEGIKIGIENCPMFFTNDEWPGGKNLAISPAIWREMFERIPSQHFGLNYDPSHVVWQFMDPARHIRDFASRIFHVHAKDAIINRARLQEVGVLANPSEYHTPKLPGLGDVDWPKFFCALTEIRYDGAVCIEVEDRAYEGSLGDRKRALIQSKRFLENFMS